MILVDTGPLVALLDRNDPNHDRCLAVARQLASTPMMTTVQCLTEAMYFAGKEGGAIGQERLWQLRQSGKLLVQPFSDTDLDRMRALMQAYADVPMDFADASLVAAAEAMRLVQVFTFDKHFHAYRINGMTPFVVTP